MNTPIIQLLIAGLAIIAIIVITIAPYLNDEMNKDRDNPPERDWGDFHE